MDNDDFQMDCATALTILSVAQGLLHLGIEPPKELERSYMHALQHLLEDGMIEPYIGSKGYAKVRFTQKFKEMSR